MAVFEEMDLFPVVFLGTPGAFRTTADSVFSKILGFFIMCIGENLFTQGHQGDCSDYSEEETSLAFTQVQAQGSGQSKGLAQNLYGESSCLKEKPIRPTSSVRKYLP